MKFYFNSFFILLMVCSSYKLSGQELSEEKKKSVQALMDSSDFYGLKDPARSFHFASRILNEVPQKGNEFIHIEALLNAANSKKMQSQKDEALRFSRQAITLGNQMNDRRSLVKSYFMKGSVFGQDDDNDSSLIAYQNVIDLHFPGMDLYFVSAAYTAVGRIYSTIGNDKKAEEYLLKGYRLSSGDEYSKIFALASLIGFYANHDNPLYLPYLDTMANSEFYQNASNESFMAHFETFLLLEEGTDAEKEKTFTEVYQYAKTHNSLVNQISYGYRLYELYTKMQRYEDAHILLLELLQKAREAKNADRISHLSRALYENSKLRGDLQSALKYLEAHNELHDSLLSVENTTRFSELNIKFETAQKDNEIEQQKIRLEQERRDRNFFIALAFLVSILTVVIFIYFRNRARSAQRIIEQEKVIHQKETERLQKEKEIAQLTATLESQEKERNRIAKDLHDGLGSMMSGISSQIEYLRSQQDVELAEQMNLAPLREMVRDATSELRRTSYELMPAKLLRQGLEPAMRDLCLNLLVKNSIEPTLEINADLTTLSPEQQLTLYRITQELLNNIIKHADAKNVFIQFTRFDNEISLVVEDDGKGFDLAAKKLDGGLGLESLQSRVDLLNGFLDIASIPGEGTTVTVNFKVNELVDSSPISES